MKRSREVNTVDDDEEDNVQQNPAKRRKLTKTKQYTTQKPLHVLRDFATLFDTQTDEDQDVLFVVGPQKTHMKAHKVILKARCEYFRMMLGSNWQEGQEQHSMVTIEKPETEPEVFKEVLRFIYSGSVVLDANLCCKCIQIALEMNLDDLISVCVQCVDDNLNETTIFQFFDASLVPHTQKLDSLKNVCLKEISKRTKQFIDRNIHSMTKNMWLAILSQCQKVNIDEHALFDYVYQWAEEQVEIESKNRTKDIASLLSALIPHIRFPTIPVKIITEKVEPLGVVPKDILFDIYKYFASKSVTNTCFSLEHTHLRNNNIIQKNERTWAVTISLRELDEKERVDSTPFMFKNVEFLIRVYWRKKPEMVEPALAVFLILNTEKLDNNYKIFLGKNFKIVHVKDDNKSIVKKINRSEFSDAQRSGGKKEFIPKSKLSEAEGLVDEGNFVLECEIVED